MRTVLVIVLALAFASPFVIASDSACGGMWNPQCPAPRLTATALAPTFTDCDGAWSIALGFGTPSVDNVWTKIVGADNVTRYDQGLGWPTFGSPSTFTVSGGFLDFASGAWPPEWPFGNYTATINASNANGASTANVSFAYAHEVDVTPPSATLAIEGAAPIDGWYAHNVWADVTTEDNCAHAYSDIRLDGDAAPGILCVVGRPCNPPATISVPVMGDGFHMIEYQAIDQQWNEGPRTEFGLRIDTTPPTVHIEAPRHGDVIVNGATKGAMPDDRVLAIGPTEFTASASDSGSGVADIAWLVDGTVAAHGASATLSLAPGEHHVAALATDVVGHSATTDALDVLSL
ncbi:MAG: hypothetical protein ACYDCK_00495 [Thermoplasmatota archaeon]